MSGMHADEATTALLLAGTPPRCNKNLEAKFQDRRRTGEAS